jgi:plasmid stabilization system protein ParE
MSVDPVYLPEAEDDIAAAHASYDAQRPGLGDEFLEALRDTIVLITDNPQLYGLFRKDIRAAPLKRFPYVVYYRDRTDDVLIIAVPHGSRSTRAWWSRTRPP